MPFTFRPLSVPDVILVESKSFPDARGFFAELYRSDSFRASGIDAHFVQDNMSRSEHRVLRGLHYQKNPDAQGKLVTVTRGEIFDVAVDLRRGSPTFGKWAGEVLSDENHRLLWVPPGFAHGFCVLTAIADVVYKVTATYSPETDRGIAWNDPTIGIEWPISEPLLSDKDRLQPQLIDADINFVYEPGKS